jgi:alanyl-tRNA synthetase
MEGFEREMEAQRERARAAARFGLGERTAVEVYQEALRLAQGHPSTGSGRTETVLSTPFVGYQRLKEHTRIIGMLVDGAPADKAAAGQQVEVILESTPFYAEAGGQVGDTGEIRAPHGRVLVADAQRPFAEVTVHRGKVAEGSIAVGDAVEAEVDEERRREVMLNHTGTHLLHAALRKVLGSHVRQAGSLVAPDRLRFDFTHLSGLSRDQVGDIQHLVNEKIRANLPIKQRADVPFDRALAEGALAFFGDKYGDKVCVIEIGTPDETFSKELCGGTHVAMTGEIGMLQIVGEGGIGSGVRRVEAVTGRGVERFVEGRLDEAQSEASQLKKELEQQQKRVLNLALELAAREAQEAKRSTTIKGVPVVLSSFQPTRAGVTLDSSAIVEVGARLRDQLKSGIVILWSGPQLAVFVTRDWVQRGYKATTIVNRLFSVVGGKGGGRPELARGGGADPEKLRRVLADSLDQFIEAG